jgi:hypothetical protein
MPILLIRNSTLYQRGYLDHVAESGHEPVEVPPQTDLGQFT